MRTLQLATIILLTSTAAYAQPAMQPATPLATQPASVAGPIDVSGNYVGTWGATTLRQDGSHVTGSYAYHDGHIDGTLADHTLTFNWTEDDSSGRGVFAIANDHSLYGTWGQGDSASNGGAWSLTPGTEPAGVSAAMGNPAGAPTTTSPLGWKTDLRMPFDIGFGGGYLDVGWLGLGLDVGNRVSNHWYVGASGDVEWMSLVGMPTSNSTSEPGDGMTARERLGGEVRYYMGDGVGYVSVNDGPYTPVPRHTWIGARAGAESFDGFSTVGAFGDVTLGADMSLGSTALGMYGSVGVSSEPASAFPQSSSSGSGTIASEAPGGSSNVTSWNITLGMRVSFGG